MVFALLFFSAFIFSASPTVTSTTHPQGEWSSARVVEVSFSMSGATEFAYVLDGSTSTEPLTTGGGSIIVSVAEADEIDLGSKLDGEYYLHVRAKADSGWSDTTHYNIKVDNNGPTRPGNPEAISQADGSIIITWGVSEDTLAGVAHYNLYRSNLRFVKDGGVSREFRVRDPVAKLIGDALTETTFHDETVVEGYRYHYKLQAVDHADNISPESSIASVRAPSFCDLDVSIEADFTSSAMKVDLSSDLEFKKGSVFVVNPNAQETTLVDEESNVKTLSAELPLAGQINGEYKVYFTAIDDDFDECYFEEVFHYDTTFPVVEILSPPITQELTEVVEFRVNVSDSGTNPSGISSVKLFLEKDGELVLVDELVEQSGAYVYDWNTIVFDNGRFNVVVKASDFAGNEAEDRGLYTFKNDFFAREEAKTNISGADAARAAAIAYFGELQEKNIAADANALLIYADSNYSYAKELFAQGYYFELSSQHALKAKALYSSALGAVSFSRYRSANYIYNQNQLDIFLGAAGLDSGVSKEATELIQELEPSRRIEILEVQNNGVTYYQANVVVGFTNTSDSNYSLVVLEVVPKKLVASTNEITSPLPFTIVQSDPIIAFEDVLLPKGRGVEIVYSLERRLTKEEANLLIASNIMNFYVSPPILLSSETGISSVRLSSLLSFNSLLSSLPPIEWNTTNLLIAGIAVLGVLFILFVIFVLVVFGIYYFFIKKKNKSGFG
ncbi:MAG: fibronectin type III domain-containing protein [archaeon]|nr:fibronectin type III domain-containing protein [archaeon]